MQAYTFTSCHLLNDVAAVLLELSIAVTGTVLVCMVDQGTTGRSISRR